jgi:hypothetical protein
MDAVPETYSNVQRVIDEIELDIEDIVVIAD